MHVALNIGSKFCTHDMLHMTYVACICTCMTVHDIQDTHRYVSLFVTPRDDTLVAHDTFDSHACTHVALDIRSKRYTHDKLHMTYVALYMHMHDST